MLTFSWTSAASQDTVSDKDVETAKPVMEQVFNRFHINYEMGRLRKMGYYKESVADSSSLYYLAEGIVEVFIPSNLDQTQNASIYPIKTRKKSFNEVEEDKLLFGNASDMARSSVWRPNSFLNEKNRENYTFFHAGETTYGGKEVMIVGFNPKDESNGHVQGQLYIDLTYFGIMHIEYKPLVSGSGTWKEISWSEDFEFINGAYTLTGVHFEGTSRHDEFHYTANLIMGQIETVSTIPEYILYIDDTIPLFEKAEERFDESFWEGFEFVKKMVPPDTSHQLVASD